MLHRFIYLLVISAVLSAKAAPLATRPQPVEEKTASVAAKVAEDTPLRGLVVLRVSEDYLKRLFTRDIDSKTPVKRVVLGTRASGRAHTVGRADVDLHPDKDEAAFEVQIKGTSKSQTVGRNGPAIICSRTNTTWECQKLIAFDGNKFQSQPATITSETRLVPTGVNSPLPGLRKMLVRKIAQRRVAECRCTAERITADHTRRQIQQQLDADVDDRVVKLNRRIHAQAILSRVLPLVKLGVIHFSTNEQCVNISFSEGGEAFSSICPVDRLKAVDTEVWIHTSLLCMADATLPPVLEDQLKWLEDALPKVKLPEIKTPEVELPDLKPLGLKDLSNVSVQFVDDWLVIRTGSSARDQPASKSPQRKRATTAAAR